VRLGIARDEAFHFYYPDNLESLQRGGAELIAFSPLADRALPEDLDGLYFGGGYPEAHAARLAANSSVRDTVRRFAASGRPVYAECGGLMYLGEALRTLDAQRHPLVGALPVETTMLKSLKTLGYAEATFADDGLWGAAGEGCRGHEFHYSEIVADRGRAEGWRPAYHLRHRRAAEVAAEGFARGGVLASYVHLHWASRPGAVAHFLARCEQRS
jgi:cobyrinic acid a,c-diamide synthase